MGRLKRLELLKRLDAAVWDQRANTFFGCRQLHKEFVHLVNSVPVTPYGDNTVVESNRWMEIVVPADFNQAV